MKKITFVTGAMGRGGAERVISLLANYYSDMGWNVSICMLLHPTVAYELLDNVRVVDLSNEKVRAVLDIPRMALVLRRYLKTEKPDVLVGFLRQIIPVIHMASSGLKMRRVYSERNDPAALRSNAVYEKLLIRAYARCDRTVLQTKRARDYFPEKVQRNSVIIPNPISVKTQAAPERRARIVTAGRLEKQKNQAMLIRAFAALHEQHPEYTLDIYGEGGLRGELQGHIDALGLADCVHLPGNVPDIHEQMADAEMFVLSSDFEGLSNALLEAMMMGLPCIATNCAGCDEVIEDGVNGLLIPVGDTQTLADALLRMAGDKAAAREMGQKAAASTEAYRLEHVMDLWRKAIEG